jgi:hypothetical protein
MKTKLLLVLPLLLATSLFAQVPQGFNYQAIARDGAGNPIINKELLVKVSILSDTTGFYASGSGNYLWEEQHSVTTNGLGLFGLVIGTQARLRGLASFNLIDWNNVPLFVGLKILNSPAPWKNMGTAKLYSVPYAMVADSANGIAAGSKLSVKSANDSGTEALFEVKRKDGLTVFAVYPNAVNIYVPRSGNKGNKGGFAIGGYDGTKGNTTPQDYFRVTPDSVRIYIDPTPSAGKGSKGGFAIGGYGEAKGGIENMYFNLTGATSVNTVVESPQILWYPQKKAFLAGSIHIGREDSVGLNSTALGYRSIAMGDYSQAFGYKAKAFSDYSTSIGKNSITAGENSFAFGNQSAARGDDSYALGSGAQALGKRSFALGSVGIDSSNVQTGQTTAVGENAFAIGFGSKAIGQGAFAIGLSDSASGPYSMAIGYKTVADGWYATSMGYGTRSSGLFSTAIGFATVVEPAGWCATATGIGTKAGNWASVAFGDRSYASGHTSFATGFTTIASGQLSSTFGDRSQSSGYAAVSMGYNTTAQSFASLVIGRYNVISGTTNTWYSSEPVFVIGNGTSSSARSNAMTVYKNGNANFSGNIITDGYGNFGGNGYFGGYANFDGYINLNLATTGRAIYVNSDEALWYDGSVFSWGYGGTRNFFSDNVSIGASVSSGHMLYVTGTSYSTGGWTGSDLRWKKNLQPLNNYLEDLLLLQGYKYNWRKDEFPEMNFENELQIGLIAQDVEKVFPELVRTDNDGYKAVSYEKLSVILLEGIKEQQKQIDLQNQKILKLEKMIGEMDDLIRKSIEDK